MLLGEGNDGPGRVVGVDLLPTGAEVACEGAQRSIFPVWPGAALSPVTT